MKKAVIIVTIFIIVFGIFICTNTVNAAEQAIDEETESRLVEIKENTANSLKDYQEKYGSDIYGLVAYILNMVRIYSIPFCFLAIVISIIYKVVLGTRNLENAEKGLGMIVAVVTLTIICQVLPLVFAIVVRFGKE